MVKHIDIEYCGAWGYSGPGNRLKTAIEGALPEVKVVAHSASGKTGRIDVSWISDSGNRNIIWTGSRRDVESSHAQIIALIKSQKWNMRQNLKKDVLSKMRNLKSYGISLRIWFNIFK